MSIDYLQDLERTVDSGRPQFATPGVSRNQWIINESIEELQRQAQRAADHKKMAVNIVRLISKHDAIAGNMFLVPTKIGEPGPRGEATIEWSIVETKEAAEMMRDVRHGPSPYFGMEVEQEVPPSVKED